MGRASPTAPDHNPVLTTPRTVDAKGPPTVDVSRPAPSDLSYSLVALRQRWWPEPLATVAGLRVAAGHTGNQPPVYVSTTSVLVQLAGQDIDVAGGGGR